MTRRVLESNADVTEIKDLLVKISARIETFIVSSKSSSGFHYNLHARSSVRKHDPGRNCCGRNSRSEQRFHLQCKISQYNYSQRLPSAEEKELEKELARWVSIACPVRSRFVNALCPTERDYEGHQVG